ncbi:MAG TPA: DUF922 domain-containing protein [Flavobacteriaceae bacterium]|nr:DUF922 domain-containing protein [Flavobacteriaceae bacterium]HRW44015.1 DUF922 domain-containing protein [Flavobacteriaceae bacterium]
MSAQTIKGVENDSIITWDKSRQLVWDDFKDAVDWNDPIGNAMTSYKIVVVPENVLVDEEDHIQNHEKLSVVANFYCYHSWVNKRTENLLRHEQTHFDIAELFARKLRKRFETLKSQGEKRFSVYYSEFKEYSALCREMQKKYDRETQHGNDFQANDTWKELIQKELGSFRDYE